ncbi:hypothetical protein [Flavobacterium sp. Arc3]
MNWKKNYELEKRLKDTEPQPDKLKIAMAFFPRAVNNLQFL